MLVSSSGIEKKSDSSARETELLVSATSSSTTSTIVPSIYSLAERKSFLQNHRQKRRLPAYQNIKNTRRPSFPFIPFVSSCLLFLVAHRTSLLLFELSDKPLRAMSQSNEYLTSRRSAEVVLQASPSAHDSSYVGFFNGLPITFHHRSMSSHVHCVGDNYQSTESWLQRSCKFSFMCFDTNTSDFVLFQSQEEQQLQDRLVKGKHSFWYTSNTMHHNGQVNHVAVGGINLKWTKAGYNRLQWFPRIEPLRGDDSDILPFYMLPDNVVMFPFHSLSAKNPGHLLWDDFLPLYTLLTMFHLDKESTNNSSTLLFLRYILPGDKPGLWASCDWQDSVRDLCNSMISKFLPVMVGLNATHGWSTTRDYNLSFTDKSTNEPRSNLICARQGVAGIASLTDHGSNKMHGWEPEDYLITHNHGRGRLLYEFRNFMMRNLNLPYDRLSSSLAISTPPFKIVISTGSSNQDLRNADFNLQAEALSRIPSVEINRFEFHKMELREQVRVASEAQFMVTFCGGGAATAMFLPRGATLLLFYSETDGVQNNEYTGLPAMLDWDLFSSLSHLKVHWISSDTMDESDDVSVLELLVRHEVELLLAQANPM